MKNFEVLPLMEWPFSPTLDDSLTFTCVLVLSKTPKILQPTLKSEEAIKQTEFRTLTMTSDLDFSKQLISFLEME